MYHRKAIVTVLGESTAAGGLIEYTLVPEYAENPVIPPLPIAAYPMEENSSVEDVSPEADYVWTVGEGESLEGEEEAIEPLNTADQTPRSIAPVPDDDEIVPQARKPAARRLKRKRVLSSSSE